jgi:hypothetical protein
MKENGGGGGGWRVGRTSVAFGPHYKRLSTVTHREVEARLSAYPGQPKYHHCI